ncbi:MAG TPA: hypothetical protein VMW16_00645 [Sedimentisphaerales bacterium]|nr:hypothetical protein [Sedimentisphaerales bacterium]
MKIDTNVIQDFFGKPSSGHLNSTKALSNNDADASLRVNYAFLIDKAMQTPDTEANAVQQAQELLQSGQLESPENIQKTAENITKFGI